MNTAAQISKFSSRLFKLHLALIITAIVPAMVQANGNYMTSTENAFDDVVFAIENAIIDRGLVIDYQGKSGDMLARTAEVNEVDSPYADARYFSFCSSKLTHAAVAANVENIAICPYVVYAYTLHVSPETTHVGYRKPAGTSDRESETAMAEIDALLRSIIDEASE